MDSGGNAPGARPVNFVCVSGETVLLEADAQDRRFCVAQVVEGVTAQVLPEPHAAWYTTSIAVDDDLSWQVGEPLVSVEIRGDDNHRLVVTRRQARAVGALLLALVLTGCGGGGDEPDQLLPTVPCVDRPQVCR